MKMNTLGLLAVAAAGATLFAVSANAAGPNGRVHAKKVSTSPLSANQPANGGSCAAPTAFTALPYSDTGTTVGGTDVISAVGLDCTQFGTVEGPEVIYSFVAGTGANASFTVTPSGGYDPAIYLVSSCTTAATCVGGADDVYSGEAESFSVSALTAGTTYYLHVDSYYPSSDSYGSGAFSLAVTGTLPVQLQEFQIN